MPKPSEYWKNEPEEHDYPAATNYLELILPPPVVEGLVARLRTAKTGHKKAKDLVRASGLSILPPDNQHVAQDLNKVSRGEKLSPVLLARGVLERGIPVTIADGYHRICASYHLDENADIPCRLVDL